MLFSVGYTHSTLNIRVDATIYTLMDTTVRLEKQINK